MILVNNANEAYSQMKNLLKDKGQKTSPRGLKIKEVLGTSVRILNPRERIITEKNRNFPFKGALAEFFWYMSQNNKIEYIIPYLKHWEKYSDDGITVNSNYGFQWKDQIQNVIEKIKRDSDTRQAVVTLYDPRYSSYYGKDNVCTPSFQFLLRNDSLNLIVSARSRDLVRGECIDQFTFTCLQELVANELEVDVGFYQVDIASLHIYEEHFYLFDSEDCFESYNKNILKTNLKYSNFWETITNDLLFKINEKDFISYYAFEKNIDIKMFYKGFLENKKPKFFLTT